MLQFDEVEDAMNSHDVHTLLENSKGMVLLCVRGEANISRWEKILGEMPGYPIEEAIMPIGIWIYLNLDVRYDVICETVVEEAESLPCYVHIC